ncbi:unnamed protein product, partial [Ectocarpus sp. 8 AP-2014]
MKIDEVCDCCGDKTEHDAQTDFGPRKARYFMNLNTNINTDKCHFAISGQTEEKISVRHTKELRATSHEQFHTHPKLDSTDVFKLRKEGPTSGCEWRYLEE